MSRCGDRRNDRWYQMLEQRMDQDDKQRLVSAIEEEMEVRPNGDGSFTVKGEYRVDPDAETCTCPDYQYRNRTCKHLYRTHLEVAFGWVEQEENERPARPVSLVPKFEQFPNALVERDQWIGWQSQWRENKTKPGKWTKVPIDVDGGFASSTNPETWTDFESARAMYESVDTEKLDGVGYVLDPDGPVVGIDLDDVRDPESGRLTVEAAKLVREADCYTEVSPSGTGIRMFAFGEKFSDGNEAQLPGEAHIEMYDRGRYLTVTGHHISGPEDVEANQDAIDLFDELVEADSHEAQKRIDDF